MFTLPSLHCSTLLMQVYRHAYNSSHSRSCRDVFQQDDALHSTPYFVNVDYSTGRILNYWMDALSASFAAVQVVFFSPELNGSPTRNIKT